MPYPDLIYLFILIFKLVLFKKLNGQNGLVGMKNFSNLSRLYLIFVFIFYFFTFYYIKIKNFNLNLLKTRL